MSSFPATESRKSFGEALSIRLVTVISLIEASLCSREVEPRAAVPIACLIYLEPDIDRTPSAGRGPEKALTEG